MAESEQRQASYLGGAMSPQRTDYILRIIEQLGAALRRARDLLARGVPGAQQALDEARTAQAELLGDRAAMLQHLDAETAAALVADPRLLQLWVDLIRAETESLRLLGSEAEAESRQARADQLDQASRSSRG